TTSATRLSAAAGTESDRQARMAVRKTQKRNMTGPARSLDATDRSADLGGSKTQSHSPLGDRPAGPAGSVREPEVHHVAVLDDVFLAFQAHFAGFLGADLAVQR